MSLRIPCLLGLILLIGSWVVVAIDEGQNLQSEVAWNNKGVILFEMGQYNDALIAFDNATKLKLEHADPWANKGITLCNNRNYVEAIQAFDKSLSIDKSQGWVWYAMGSAYNELGNHIEGEKFHAKGINIDPDAANAWTDRMKNPTFMPPPH